MAYNPLNPKKTNYEDLKNLQFNTGIPPQSMLPSGERPGSVGWFRSMGAEDVQPQQAPLSAAAPTPESVGASTAAPTTPAIASAPAKFVNQGTGAATPRPEINPFSGSMTISDSPGATAGVNAAGDLIQNQDWNSATKGGGTVNVMSPEMYASTSPTPAPAAATGEVWAGKEGQALREQLTRNMNLAMQKANAPYTAERGTSAETGGNRQQWANLAKEFGDTLNTGMNAQGVEREAAMRNALTGAEIPSQIRARQDLTAYQNRMAGVSERNAETTAKESLSNEAYRNRMAGAAEDKAVTAQERAANQLEIAQLKAGAGKYGDTATAVEELKGEGFAPNPQAVDAFQKGYTFVPGTKATKTGIPGFRTEQPAVRGHMVPPDWKPTLDKNGKPVVKNGTPLYTDASGRTDRIPTIYGK